MLFRVFISFFLFFPLTVFAQSFECRLALQERREITSERSALISEYPFTAAAIASCARQPQDEVAGCILTYCVGQAFFRPEGGSGCTTFASRMGELEKRLEQNTSILRNYNCL